MAACSTLRDRSFAERLRIAALTLWVPIMLLALISALVVSAAPALEAHWAIVAAGCLLVVCVSIMTPWSVALVGRAIAGLRLGRAEQKDRGHDKAGKRLEGGRFPPR